jgi:hypothetical protein
VVQAPTSKGVHTSYKSGCGSVSWSVGHTAMTCRYVLNSFSLYIVFVNCLANNLKFNLQPWPFNDSASRPLLGYRWSKITHLTGTIEGRYMTYSNAFDCITSGQVRQHLFTCRIFNNINKCQIFSNLQVTWQPYETDAVHGIAFNDICRHDQDLWTAVVPLICYYVVEWHLPIRVMCQFGRLQTVAVQHELMSHSLPE